MDAAYQKRINTAENNAKVATQRYLNMSGYKNPEENTAAPTTMTMADVEATAKASGKSVEEVKTAAKAKGITIK